MQYILDFTIMDKTRMLLKSYECNGVCHADLRVSIDVSTTRLPANPLMMNSDVSFTVPKQPIGTSAMCFSKVS